MSQLANSSAEVHAFRAVKTQMRSIWQSRNSPRSSSRYSRRLQSIRYCVLVNAST
ncbi:hypothetical protein OHI65_21315 [Brucella sp. MAB-22]|uniref:hypothetical protein n=1 Tax=Brucella sp. MAB-22 TaxID=2986424 RepID=UPI00221ED412|nr:hypothetical protein [Brucella sp. MAB-22]UYT58116.1 hypothetical protein OHI65_21315 [Brucella sp. MAB-22]